MTGAERPAGTAGPTTDPQVLACLRGVAKVFPGAAVAALDDVDLDVARASAVALTGPSGSGKSTLLHVMGAMLRPDRGRVLVDGTDVAALSRRELVAYRRTVGFVFQRFQLLPALSVLGNVLAPVLADRPGRETKERAAALLERVGLADRADTVPAKLSGGQQQRVAIARALLGRPRLLLADEPTGNLDSATGGQILDLLLEARDRDGVTLVIATHDAAVAERCDRTVSLRDGRLVTDLSPA